MTMTSVCVYVYIYVHSEHVNIDRVLASSCFCVYFALCLFTAENAALYIFFLQRKENFLYATSFSD